ncbi:MAG TPA: hypothetical protein VE758_08955, partial [Chthoniobacterales bacterium]|nr:hypothetical protein [Chthoniobacterales bacterium]
MGEESHASAQARRRFWRSVALGSIATAALLIVFLHRPLLRSFLRVGARHFAAGQHLKLEFRLEGTAFTNLALKNVRITPTGPSGVESIDIGSARADYSFCALLFHGPSEFLRNIELQSARVVLNPAAAPLQTRPPKRRERITLPSIFPTRLHLADVSVLVRNKPHDVALEHVDLELDPHHPAALHIGRLQLPGGEQWTNVSAQTSYADKNLTIRDLFLDERNQFRVINIDASRIRSKILTASVEAALGGPFTASVSLQQTNSSLNTQLAMTGERIPVATLNKYLALPEGYLSGEVERLSVDLRGTLNRPDSWNGSASAQISNFRHPQIVLDRCLFTMWARNGHLSLAQGELVQGANEFHVRGSAELPRELKQIGQDPMSLEISAAAVDLARLTANLPQHLTGSAQVNGRIDVSGGKANANFSAEGGSIGFADGVLDRFNLTFSATNSLAQTNATTPWFADVQSAVHLQAADVRYRDYVFDALSASLRSTGELLQIEQVSVARSNNNLMVQGQYRLPNQLHTAASQDLQLNCEINAPQIGEFWVTDSPDRISGPLEISGQIQRKNGVANGLITLYGADLALRNAVFKQLSAHCSIWNNIV